MSREEISLPLCRRGLTSALQGFIKNKGSRGRASEACALPGVTGWERGDAGGSGSPSEGGGSYFPASVCDGHRGAWPWQRERRKAPLNGCFIPAGAGNSIPSARRGRGRLGAEGSLRGCVPRGDLGRGCSGWASRIGAESGITLGW